jgi:hypothetical protein
METGTTVAVEEPAETEPEAIEPAETAPTAQDPDKGRRKTLTLFDRVRQIPKADWGTRAFIYVYCLEPICDLKMGGEKKYLVKSKEPIMDEDSIMMDYGSGKYRLQLVYRKPAADKADQIDACEIEIYNPKYPPKIPQSVWMNDPRNARWLALLPKEEPPKPDTPMGSITETFKVFSDMRRDVRDELKPATVAEAPKVQDPLEMATKILQIQNGTSNPIIGLFEKQMEAMGKAAESARQREADLQKEIRDQLRAQHVAPVEKMDALDMLLKASDKLQPLFEKFMPKLTEAAGNVVSRASRPRPLEQMIDIGLPILGDVLKPFANMIAAKMAAGPQPANGAYPAPTAPTTIQQPPQPGIAAAPAPPPRVIQFMQNPIVMGAFNSHFKDYLESGGGEDGTDGSDFAYWIYKAVGEGPLTDARAMGTTAILNMFKAAPQWPAIQQHEAKLTAFIDEILGWKPEAMEPDPNEPQAVDLTQTA